MDTDPMDVTEILARPGEYARRYENMAAQVVQAQAERDAARAEVARLTAALAAMVDVYSEFDAYPTSDSHPIYAARAALRGQPATATAQQRSTSDGVTWHTFGGNTPPEQVANPANRCTCDLSDTPDAPADWHFETCPEYKPAPARAKE